MFSSAIEIAQSLYRFIGLITKRAEISIVSDGKLKSDAIVNHYKAMFIVVTGK